MKEFLVTTLIILFTIFWTLLWKGIALWKAARNGHKKWFVFLLIFSTFGIFEMVYIFIFGKKKVKENINSLTQVKPK